MRGRRSPLSAEKAHHSFHTCLIYFFVVYLRKPDCLHIVVYLPPGFLSESLTDTFSHVIDIANAHLLIHPNSDIILCGDLNQYDMRAIESHLSVTNVVIVPTRLNNVLDKVFLSSDILHLYSEPVVLPPLSTSDHKCVFLKPVIPSSLCSVTHCVFDYRRSHLDHFSSLYLELISLLFISFFT